MNNINLIYSKLEQFIRKYYTNQLIKGIFFFIGLGLIYFLFTLFIEYFLWLKPAGRTLLFWLFVGVELFLFLRFICFPVFKLFKIQKGIGYKQASTIIGNHFTEVSDKLTNFLQLSENQEKSELLLASIEQKAQNLSPVPFTNAVDFKKSLKYLPLAIVPILLFLLFFVSGNADVITQSMNRVVHYSERYSPPAPFEFLVHNSELKVKQGEDFILKVSTQGKVVPEKVLISFGNESYYLENTAVGEFQYRFTKPVKDIDFHIQANSVTSKDYVLKVIEVPVIANFEMQLNFPAYLGRKSETVKGTGNAMIPEGTKITWKVNAQTTQKVEWESGELATDFSKEKEHFVYTKNIFENTDYQILTSNQNVQHYEKLQYRLGVIKDAFPTIAVGNLPDSLGISSNVLLGEISDDYGLTKLQVVYYKKSNPDAIKSFELPVNKGVFDRFHYTFPNGLDIEQGIEYEYYFEVFDNDALHNFKSSKSSVFSHRELTDEEKQDENLRQQSENLNSLSQSVKSQEKQLSELEKFKQLDKEKKTLDFKDQKKIDDFLKRQQQQEEMMKSFSEKLKQNLSEFNPEKEDQHKELLEQRLEKTQEEIEKNQKLLEELKELAEKLQKEELFDKMEKFKQNAKSQQKSLEQLVELTKRFYVERKLEKIASDLDKLSEKQEELSEKSDKENTSEKQNELNKEFDKIQKDIDDLNKENKELKNPMELPTDKKEEEKIEQDMQKAEEDLQKENKKNAKPKQKSAAQKMKKMSQKMQAMMMEMSMEQMEEDSKMLRQILDNLLAFSFSQEDVMLKFKEAKPKSPSYGNFLRTQHNLKTQFRHVDDSLFALSLRNPMIGEEINKEIGNIHYNVDKSLEELAEMRIPKGTSHQQYTVTSANKLAEFLSNIQDQMQMQMQGAGMPKPGQGGEGDMQLPDIMKKQGELSEKMKKGMKKGEQEGEGEEGEKGEKGGSQGGEGSEGEGSDGEGDAGMLYEIYKEQQMLREALQKQLEKQGMGGAGQNATKQMEDIEKQLLNKGFQNSVLEKMQNLKHELLKLDRAMKQQGEDDKRESNTNRKEYNQNTKTIDPKLQEYLNSIEILNRDALPLHPVYNQKVQQYFKK
ncbi:MAG: hypothetical protein WCY89_04045 [Flavobacteriaceae bacterium]